MLNTANQLAKKKAQLLISELEGTTEEITRKRCSKKNMKKKYYIQNKKV